MDANRGNVAKNEAATSIMPISSLNPYHGRWTIKARVTIKTELRVFANDKGVGKVFSFDLLSSEGGEIRVTCFNDVADRFYNVIEQGRVYMISRGTVRPAKKKFNYLDNDYEIFLDNASKVQDCLEDDKSIPEQKFSFCSICDIDGMDSGSVLDVIGVVTSIDEARLVKRTDNSEILKRTLQIMDMSCRTVEITMWGKFCNAEGSVLANLCDSRISPVLALKCGTVNDLNGTSVGTIANSQLFIDPDIHETHTLKVWFDYDREGKVTPDVSLSRNSYLGLADEIKVISQIKDDNLGTSDRPDWITVFATLTFIKIDNFCYPACPIMIGSRQCNKKVLDDGDGKFRCERCERAVDKCDYRYILQMQIQDLTGLTWVSAFQESGFKIMGISAEELHNLKCEDYERFTEVVRNVLFTKFNFNLKVEGGILKDEQRVNSTVVKVEKLNSQAESQFLLDSIAKFNCEFQPRQADMGLEIEKSQHLQ